MIAAKPSAFWVERCAQANVPCGHINHMHEVFADPQVRHRELAIKIPHGSGRDIAVVRSPLNLSRTPVVHRAPPGLGADTERVLMRFGRSKDEIETLRASSVV